MTGSAVPQRCTAHPEEKAGWYCDRCQRALCGQCTALELPRFYCVHCEGVARQFTRSRSARSFARIAGRALVVPVVRHLPALLLLTTTLTAISSVSLWFQEGSAHGRGPLLAVTESPSKTVAPSAAPSATLVTSAPLRASVTHDATADFRARFAPLVHPTAVAMTWLVLIATLVIAAGVSARGAEEERGQALRAVKACGAAAIVWLPGVLYYAFVQRGALSNAMYGDWLLWLYAVLAFAYAPSAFAVTARSNGVVRAFNPFVIVECAWRVRRRYGLTVLSLAALVAAAICAETFGVEAVKRYGVPVLPELAVALAVSTLVLQAAHLIGSLTNVYGYEFGIGHKEDYREPLLAGVNASGALKHWADRLVKPTIGSGKAVKRKAREVTRTLREGNAAKALRLYEAHLGEWPEDTFAPADRYALGQAAVTARSFEIAKALFESLADRTDITGGRALVGLAKLYETQWDDKVRAGELYRQVAERFRGTDIARFAERRLGVEGFPGEAQRPKEPRSTTQQRTAVQKASTVEEAIPSGVQALLCRVGLHRWGPWVSRQLHHMSKPNDKEPWEHYCIAQQRFCAHCGKNSPLARSCSPILRVVRGHSGRGVEAGDQE